MQFKLCCSWISKISWKHNLLLCFSVCCSKFCKLIHSLIFQFWILWAETKISQASAKIFVMRSNLYFEVKTWLSFPADFNLWIGRFYVHWNQKLSLNKNAFPNAMSHSRFCSPKTRTIVDFWTCTVQTCLFCRARGKF